MMNATGRPGQPMNPAQQQQQQPYGPYSQTGPTSSMPGQGGMMQSGQQQPQQPGLPVMPGQQGQQQPGMMNQQSGMPGPGNRMGQPNQMLNQMNQPQNPMAPNQMGQMGPRPGGPQAQPRAINQQQQAQLQQKKPRFFMAMFDYDPSTMSPNPDGCEEELAFQEGDTIKVGIFWFFLVLKKDNTQNRHERAFIKHYTHKNLNFHKPPRSSPLKSIRTETFRNL